MKAWIAGAAALLLVVSLAGGCVFGPTESAVPSDAASPSLGSIAASVAASASPEPTPEPTPAFALAHPGTSDARAVEVTVEPSIDEASGELLVTVTNTAEERIDEIVLRWATDLDEVLFLAPFEPSDDRIREGGPPLVQEWTKWVVGPGERGEPEGTTSLGYGPILAGTTLAIPIIVERRDPGPIEFDLQVLSGNDLLQLADGSGAAVLRVEIP
jgi:hypothetical protein